MIKAISMAFTFHHHHHHHQQQHWQNGLFLVIAFLTKFCQVCLELGHLVSFSLDFATIIFYRVKSSALCSTPSLEDQIL
jgi:hypothetical protein